MKENVMKFYCILLLSSSFTLYVIVESFSKFSVVFIKNSFLLKTCIIFLNIFGLIYLLGCIVIMLGWKKLPKKSNNFPKFL